MRIQILDYFFEGPFKDPSDLKNFSGVYAILCSSGPKNWDLLDVGESQKIKSRIQNHDRTKCWQTECKSQLSYAALYTPSLDEDGRRKIEKKIRDKFNPKCGVI